MKPKIVFPYPDHYSLGVEYVAAHYILQGYKAHIYKYKALDTLLNWGKRFNPNKIAKDILKIKPNIVAFSCVTDNYRAQLSIAKEIKRQTIKIKTIFGGVHPTAVPDIVSKEIAIDEVCNGDLVDIRTIFPHKFYYHKLYNIITSIGCPYKCTYCFNSYKKQSTIQRDPGHVIQELLNASYAKYIVFRDDNFTLNDDWLHDFLNEYHRKIHLPFFCISSPYNLSGEKLQYLSVAGCIDMEIGVQSFNSEFCKGALNRKIDVGHTVHILKEAKRIGISIQTDHILGVPGDTIENQKKALDLYSDIKPDNLMTFWLRYYPMTKISESLNQADKDLINNGYALNNRLYMLGGDATKEALKIFLGISFVMNWNKYLPKWLTKLILEYDLYKYMNVNNLFFHVSLPRLLQALLNRKDFRGRDHVVNILRGGLGLRREK